MEESNNDVLGKIRPPDASEMIHEKNANRLTRLLRYLLRKKQNITDQEAEAIHTRAEQISAKGASTPPVTPTMVKLR